MRALERIGGMYYGIKCGIPEDDMACHFSDQYGGGMGLLMRFFENPNFEIKDERFLTDTQ